MTDGKLRVSIGIPAYNEEANIGKLLNILSNQKIDQANGIEIEKIYVIASGCTDKTVEIAEKAASKIPVLQVIKEATRRGKSAAINTFLTHAKGDIVIICSSDILPEDNTIEKLCLPFRDSHIGMVGGHPVPINSTKKFMGFCVTTLWELHHEIAQKDPKCGEIIAFRNVIREIPKDSPVDEASIEAAIKGQGLLIAYAPDAIVHNKGPESWKEFLEQRRRINYGHLWIKKRYGHKVATGSTGSVAVATLKKLTLNIKKDIWLIGLVSTELLSKILARIDYWKNKNSYALWKRLDSTKNLS